MDLLSIVEGASVGETRPDASMVVVDEQPGQVPGSTSVVAPRATLRFNAANVRREMAGEFAGLSAFETEVSYPSVGARQEPDMEMVEL
jgi:hypothetical protein